MFDLLSNKNLPYFLYMAESEGLDNIVDTSEAKLNAIGRELADKGYCGRVVPQIVFETLCYKHKLNNITRKDIQYIERKWL